MTKRKKSPSFDAMVRFFLQHYNIATKNDINRVIERLDALEKTVKKTSPSPHDPGRRTDEMKLRFNTAAKTASEVVYDVIAEAENGIRFAEIKEKTGLEDKKLRNIIYRLGKLDRIKTKKRGVYLPV